MQRPAGQLRRDALAIWKAGVDAVRSERLVRQGLRVDGSALWIAEERLELGQIGRIVVVGAGKAGAGMAAGVEETLGPRLLEQKQVTGWVNVPEDCVHPLARIHLHGARPAGVNEPTAAGASGSQEILRLVGSLRSEDLCLCLISGGGSALMPAPVEAVTLEDKLAVTRHLSASGANIEQLNAVRKQLSRIKGGGLARACRAGRLVALIISDVLGDPLDVIASGPTVEDSSTPWAALEVLEQFGADKGVIPDRVFSYLEEAAAGRTVPATGTVPVFAQRKWDCPPRHPNAPTCRVTNLIIGNNATAVEAAGRAAEQLGYSAAVHSAERSEGAAEDVGRALAEEALQIGSRPGPDCLIHGGEPVVKLVEAAHRGLGGRNQQLVLAAAERLFDGGADDIVLLSGGTDGEDGPTDAAGAVLDASVIAAARQQGLSPGPFLARNDAYHFFDPLGALIRTGPTHTNVCDVRVVLVSRSAS